MKIAKVTITLNVMDPAERPLLTLPGLGDEIISNLQSLGLEVGGFRIRGSVQEHADLTFAAPVVADGAPNWLRAARRELRPTQQVRQEHEDARQRVERVVEQVVDEA